MLKILRHLYHISLYAFAAITLVAAVCVTLIRLTLPNIGEYQEDIQMWLTESMGQPVRIKNIDANWRGWIPHFYLHDIKILEKDAINSIVDFKSAHITIDLFASLRKKQFVPAQMIISGMDLTLSRKKDGSINVTKAGAQTNREQIESTELTVWLLKQRKIAFTDTRITFVDLSDKDYPSILLTDVSLGLKSNEYRLQIEGDAQLPSHLGERLYFAFDAQGDILTPKWSGTLYSEGSNINLSVWLKDQEVSGVKVSSAPGNIKLWSDWRNAKVRDIQGLFDISNVELQSGPTHFNIEHLAAGLTLARRADGGLDIFFAIKDLITKNGQWPESNISISKHYSQEDDSYRYIGQADYLKLEDLILLQQFLPEFQNKRIDFEKFYLQGDLKNTLLAYDPLLPTDEQFFVSSEINLSRATIHPGDDTEDPNISGLSGHLVGNRKEGTFSVNSELLELNLTNIFETPLIFSEINGDIKWHGGSENWIVTTHYLNAQTTDFSSGIKGSLTFGPDKALPFADLIINIKELRLDRLADHLPHAVPDEAKAWMEKSLVAGDLKSIDVVLRGDLTEFPFNNNEGQLELFATVQNATLDYDPNWVPIDGIDAEIKIDSSTLTVSASSGKIYDADITEAIAVIPDLAAADPKIIINGHVKGHTSDAKLLIAHSPLAESITLAELMGSDMEGFLALTLGLDIPTNDEDIKVEGELDLQDTRLYSPNFGIGLEKINGTVNFTENLISATDITANYSDQAVLLGIQSSDDDYREIKLEGDADKDFIVSQLVHYFPSFKAVLPEVEQKITGNCQWRAVLSIDSRNNIEPIRKLSISSSLYGLSLDLPAPLGKTEETRPLEVTALISDIPQQTIDFKYGEILTGKVELDEQKNPILTKIVLGFGPDAITPNNRDGITVTGQIDRFVISDWLEFIDLQAAQSNGSILNTLNANVDITSLEFVNQSFNKVTLNISKPQLDWIIDIKGSDIDGEIKLPSDEKSRPLTAIFDRLAIAEHQAETESDINPKQLPPLQVNVRDFQYGDIELGEVTLNTSSIPDGMAIDELSFKKPGLDISGSGIWKLIDEQNTSQFNITLHTSHIDLMLDTFGYSVASIKEGEANLNIGASWQGTPTDFSFETLDGKIEIDIGKGQFLDIQPNAGRLFGLLSIQTLPRRLSLDFSDLFSKGLAFDKITGAFSIEAGNAYTNNLFLTGPSANIAVTGRTGLTVQDYDQVVTVTPQVADSLPVASALFGPIGLGIGAVIFLAGEMFDTIPKQIDKLLRYEYTIKGSWDDPIVERFKSNDKSDEPNPISGAQKQKTS